jgi:hypothetical protein
MKTILPVLLLLPLLAAPAAVQAQLRYATNGPAITITGWSGSGGVNIPATINGLPVTSINANAFAENPNGPWYLTSVTIPGSVTKAGRNNNLSNYLDVPMT